MSENDIIDVVATLSRPIVAELVPDEAPQTEAAMQTGVEAWFLEDRQQQASAKDPVSGMGLGVDWLTSGDVIQTVVETLSALASVLQLREALRAWRGRHGLSSTQLDHLMKGIEAVEHELRAGLTGLGVEANEANRLAAKAISALAAKISHRSQTSNHKTDDPPTKP